MPRLHMACLLSGARPPGSPAGMLCPPRPEAKLTLMIMLCVKCGSVGSGSREATLQYRSSAHFPVHHILQPLAASVCHVGVAAGAAVAGSASSGGQCGRRCCSSGIAGLGASSARAAVAGGARPGGRLVGGADIPEGAVAPAAATPAAAAVAAAAVVAAAAAHAGRDGGCGRDRRAWAGVRGSSCGGNPTAIHSM